MSRRISSGGASPRRPSSLPFASQDGPSSPREAEQADQDNENSLDHTSRLWQTVCKAGCETILRERQGWSDERILKTVLDKEGSAPAVTLDVETGEISFATQGFENMVGLGRGQSKPVKYKRLADICRPDDKRLDTLINGNRWEKIDSLREDRSKAVVEIMLGQKDNGKLFWMLIHGFPVGSSWLVLTFEVLNAPTPDSLSKSFKSISSDTASHEMDCFNALVAKVHGDIEAKSVEGERETVASIARRAELNCATFTATLATAFEGEHFVPLIGMESVKLFEERLGWEAVCSHMETELKIAWEVNELTFADLKCKGVRNRIACAVADPGEMDCPLLYVSQGFEMLTGYQQAWAMGRNHRFLQPRQISRARELNGEEIDRMEKYCAGSHKLGHMVSLQLNEAADGSHFWNLVFLNHVKAKGRHYIVAVHTSLFLHKETLDGLVYNTWNHNGGKGKKNLAQLREAFMKEESNYSPKTGSLIKLANDIISVWAFEAGRESDTCWEGGSYVPKVGRPAVEEFVGVWPTLMEEAANGIRALFDMSDATIGNMKANQAGDHVVCAVSDPTALDCPLVYLSQGFENMTGYRNDFALGRNCRFLQPNMPMMNKKINGDELQRMREFCRNFGAQCKGTKIVNLLLNERITGERFWNLLHMEHVMSNGHPYILAVQTILDLPMPMLLRDQHTSKSIEEYDSTWLTSFVDELSFFLDQLRSQLRRTDIKSVMQEAENCSKSILNFMRRNCGDFEGDHLVPRVGYAESDNFERDKVWKCILRKVQSLLVDIWGVSDYNDEEVACAVSDPNGPDCPLVYVSQKFERMTGYSRDWVLGRNCRFLQPNDNQRNMHFNEEDKMRMREFCSKPQPEGTRIFNLLVNESKQGYPFWNLLIMEHVEISGTDYIFAVQTTPDIELERMTEMLTMCEDGIHQLTRLRGLFRERENNIQSNGLLTIANDVIREWVADFPVHMEMPRFHLGPHNDPVNIPLAGILMTPQEPLAEIFHAGLEDGVRHFALALSQDEYIDDTSYVEKVSHLLTLRIAELLNKMRRKYLHYMRQGIVFTLISRPQYIDSFKGISKALASYGYGFRVWLLDVRHINAEKVLSKGAEQKLMQCFEVMRAALQAGDVKAIGLYGPIGSIMQTMHAFRYNHNHHEIAVLALDDHPTKEQDPSRVAKFKKLYVEEYGSPKLWTYQLYGPHNSFLKNKGLQDCAQALDMDVCTLLIKWAEAQNYGALVPRVTDEEINVAEKEESWPVYHRRFTRNYARTAGAEECGLSCVQALRGEAQCVRRGSRTKTLPVGQHQQQIKQAVRCLVSHRDSAFENARRGSGAVATPSQSHRVSVDDPKADFPDMVLDRRASGSPVQPIARKRREARARTLNPSRFASFGTGEMDEELIRFTAQGRAAAAASASSAEPLSSLPHIHRHKSKESAAEEDDDNDQEEIRRSSKESDNRATRSSLRRKTFNTGNGPKSPYTEEEVRRTSKEPDMPRTRSSIRHKTLGAPGSAAPSRRTSNQIGFMLDNDKEDGNKVNKSILSAMEQIATSVTTSTTASPHSTSPQPPAAARNHPSNPARSHSMHSASTRATCDDGNDSGLSDAEEKVPVSPSGKPGFQRHQRGSKEKPAEPAAPEPAAPEPEPLSGFQARQAQKLKSEGWTPDKAAEFLECDVGSLMALWGA